MRVLKWSVSVDGQPHDIGAGPVVLVGCQHYPDYVPDPGRRPMSGQAVENGAAPWRPVPGHAPTETADIFGGYLCECGASWTWTHDEQVRVIPPAQTDGAR